MARITLELLDSIRSDEYDVSVVRFAAKNWEVVSDRVARRTINWLRSNAVDMTPALQVLFLELDEKALRYIQNLSRAGQRFVLNSLGDDDVVAMTNRAHDYSVIVPELWDVIIDQVEAGTFSKRELAAFEARDRLPRAFKQAIASSNIASVTELSDAIGHAARNRRAHKVDYLKAFEEARTVVQIRNDAELLLKACNNGQVESTSAARRALRNVIKAGSSSEVRAAKKDVLARFSPSEKRTSTRTPKVVENLESDLLTAFLSSTRSTQMQESAGALLRGARRAGIKLTASQRRALKAVVEVQRSADIRAAYKSAAIELAADVSVSVKPQKTTNRSTGIDGVLRRRTKVEAQSDTDHTQNVVDDWLEASGTEAIKRTSAQMLKASKNARRSGISLSAEVRECLDDVQAAESRSEIRAAYRDAVNAYKRDNAQESHTGDDSGRLARTIESGGDDPYEIPDNTRVSRRRVGADRSKDTDFSDTERVTSSIRRVRRPQDNV